MKKTILTICLMLAIPCLLSAQIMNVFSTDGKLAQHEISKIDSITFSSKIGTLTWIGHSSLKIITNDGIVIYIDPYADGDYSEHADIVLVTHGHGDHNKIDKITQKDQCYIYSGEGADVGGTKMAAGDSTEVLGIKIKAVEAYNGNHPQGSGVGFVLEINGLTIYHSGDTDKITEMAEYASMNIDYAFLCIDGKYNMGPAEAMLVAEVIQAKKVIPFHTGFTDAEKKQNVENFNPPNKLILQEGDTIYL